MLFGLLDRYKYIYKGPDRAAVSAAVRNAHRHDEVTSFEDMRYFGAAECCWRLFGFSLYEMRPTVVRLNMHLHNEQLVYHYAGHENRAASAPPASKLLDWVFFCRAPVSQPPLPLCWRDLTYMQFPGYFVHDRRTGWRAIAQRTVRFRTVGRLPPIAWTVANEELYYLRVLLCHITAGDVANELQQLQPYETPTINHLKFGHTSFKDACRARGLASDDTEWLDVIEEACRTYNQNAVLRLVVFILAYNAPTNVDALLRAAYQSIAERTDNDVRTAQRLDVEVSEVQYVRAVLLVQDALEASVGGSEARSAIQRLVLTPAQQHMHSVMRTVYTEPAAIRYERDYDRAAQQQLYDEKAVLIAQQPSQQDVLDAVQQAIRNDAGGMFFISAYAGCGKTFLEQALLHWVRKDGHIALAVASTGIASLLLEGGNTLHAKLKAPLSPYTEDSRLNIGNQSAEAQMIREAKLLIWDEAVMHPHMLAQVVDKSFRDIRGRRDVPFGGLVVVWGGDFRQTLPIEERATEAQTVSMCLHQLPGWNEEVRVLALTENQRCVQLMSECTTAAEQSRVHRWKEWLEQLADGTVVGSDNLVELWHEQCRSVDELLDYDRLLDSMYGTDVDALLRQPHRFWADRAIVTPKHCAVDFINQRMLARLPGQAHSLSSVDTLDLENGELDVGSDFLNRQLSGNMAPHRLILKDGCVVMLLRNLDKRNGLVNGTRLQVRHISRRLLHCVILTAGAYQGNDAYIPRIRMKPKSRTFPFAWTRLQFPLKLSYAMTYVLRPK